MKARMSSAGVKGLLVQHAEKIVLGLTVLLLGFFFWSAFRLAPLPETKNPDRLAALVTEAKGKIDVSSPPAIETTTQNWVAKVDDGLEPVPVGPYTFATEFDRPKVPAIVKRPEPALLPIEDLRATAVIISIPVQPGVQPVPVAIPQPAAPVNPAVKAPRGPRRPNRGGGEEGGRTRRGANDVYNRGEEDREQPRAQPRGDSDSTAEAVRNGAQVNGAQGEVRNAVVLVGRVPYAKQLQEFQSRFSDAAMPQGHTLEKDIPQYLEFKLERQEIRDGAEKPWVLLDVEAAWRDQARWVTTTTEVVATPYIYEVTTFPMPPTLARDWGNLATHPTIPLASAVDLSAAEQTDAGAELAGPFNRRINSRIGETRSDDRGPRSNEEGDSVSSTLQAHVPYFLFRYVDTQALETGKQYRYRVSLQLLNPNYEISAGLLENLASQKTEVRWTPASEASAAVTIGRDKRLLASAIKYGKNFTDTLGTLHIHLWDRKKGYEIAAPLTTPLGGIVDLLDKVTGHLVPATGYTVEEAAPYTFRFDRTEAGPPMLADARGGEPMAGSTRTDRVDRPVELIFFDVAGRPLFTNEAVDAADVKFYDARYVDKSAIAAPAGGGLFEGEGPTLLRQPGGR